MSEQHPTIQGIKVVNRPTRARLTDRQVVDYEDYKTRLIEWLLHCGKSPEKGEGYARSTVRQVAQRADTFYRWVWDERERYTTEVGAEDAEGYVTALIYAESEYSAAHMANTQKCLKRLFKWRRHALGEEVVWEPEQRSHNRRPKRGTISR